MIVKIISLINSNQIMIYFPDSTEVLLQTPLQPDGEPQGRLAHHGARQDEEAACRVGLLLPRRSGKHQCP